MDVEVRTRYRGKNKIKLRGKHREVAVIVSNKDYMLYNIFFN